MRDSLKLLGAILATLVFMAVIAGVMSTKHPTHSALDAVVKVELLQGHGSGVHLGNGIILTARHVIEGEESIKVRDVRGVTAEAKVLWSSKEYDVALLVTTYAGPSANLRCVTPLGAGEGINAAGSPGSFEFIVTYGHAAATGKSTIEGPDGPIEISLLDINGGRGMSGGPVFDERHRVVGIMSMMTDPKYLHGSFSLAIPATNICRLLAR